MDTTCHARFSFLIVIWTAAGFWDFDYDLLRCQRWNWIWLSTYVTGQGWLTVHIPAWQQVEVTSLAIRHLEHLWYILTTHCSITIMTSCSLARIFTKTKTLFLFYQPCGWRIKQCLRMGCPFTVKNEMVVQMGFWSVALRGR